jgi:hypothetical protein
MLIKALGALDFVGGLILLFGAGVKIPIPILIILALIFLVKSGIGLLRDSASWIDFTAGVILLLMIFFPVYWIVNLVVGISLIQKGIVSFL